MHPKMLTEPSSWSYVQLMCLAKNCCANDLIITESTPRWATHRFTWHFCFTCFSVLNACRILYGYLECACDFYSQSKLKSVLRLDVHEQAYPYLSISIMCIHCSLAWVDHLTSLPIRRVGTLLSVLHAFNHKRVTMHAYSNTLQHIAHKFAGVLDER